MSDFARDVEVWQQWRDNPTPETTSGLLDQVQGLIRSAAKRSLISGSTGGKKRIPPPVIAGKAQTVALDILKNYKPEHAKISTYLTSWLHSKLSDELNRYQNVVRIPHGKSEHIGKVQRLEQDLYNELGRSPNNEEIARLAGLSPDQVNSVRFQSSQQDYIASKVEIETGFASDPYERAKRQTYAELPAQDKALFDLWINQDKSGHDIMNMLNLSRRQLQAGQDRIRDQLNQNVAYAESM